MTAKMHLLSSLSVGLLPVLAAPLPLPQLKLYLAGLVVGSLWPDLDEPSSLIGSRLRFISDAIKAVFGHRGLTHTPAAWIVYALALSVAFALSESYWDAWEFFAFSAGFLLGNLFHALGDMATKEGGIAILYPISSRRYFLLPSALRFKTGGWVEVYLLSPAFVLAVLGEAYALYGAIAS